MKKAVLAVMVIAVAVIFASVAVAAMSNPCTSCAKPCGTCVKKAPCAPCAKPAPCAPCAKPVCLTFKRDVLGNKVPVYTYNVDGSALTDTATRYENTLVSGTE